MDRDRAGCLVRQAENAAQILEREHGPRRRRRSE